MKSANSSLSTVKLNLDDAFMDLSSYVAYSVLSSPIYHGLIS